MKACLASIFLFLVVCTISAQQVPIQNYSVDANGRVRIEIQSSTGKYYVLRVRHHPDSAFHLTTSMSLGDAGSTILSEPLKAYPQSHYQVWEYDSANPFDTDGDGLNDLAEFNNMPLQGPLNAASSVPAAHGLVCLNTVEAFHAISTLENNTPWVDYLNEVEYTKFIILDFYSSTPKIYFMNSAIYALHAQFGDYLGINHLSPSVIKGQLIYNPSVMAGNGSLGTYTFNFSNNEAKDFKIVQRTQELLAANMPFLNNNLAYFITENNEQDYQDNISLYQNSRVPVVFESDVYAGINYWGLNQAEGYGFLRVMSPGEVPDIKDIVLYEVIPNSLPRVGGIITSVIQTPLAHVNLRAIHDNVPNAFIRNPLQIDSIADLVNHYVYFKTNASHYEIREASIEEVNAWYENLRPAEAQTPPLNLSYTEYLPLSEISFGMFDGFGAKTSNLATMQSFGFPEGTIPDGFGIPFYFYQEFMKHNGFFNEIELMLKDPAFISDRNVRDVQLSELRNAIEDGAMPAWMMEKLASLQQSFPAGTSIRCRSSTNNEDLPGFSGAGLYDSKTHHPNEGHLSKTIKEVYASLWNLRAYEEREFYRVNHLVASMGVLCHPNFEDEKVNGVGVSADPIYNTKNTFYLNSQLGEELITNPESTYPEEMLVKRYPDGVDNISVIQYSSLVNGDSLLMSEAQIDELRAYLAIIHDRFAILYRALGNPSFAMDIEYKINSEGQLVIKQARPWVSYLPAEPGMPVSLNCNFSIFPNPGTELVNLSCEACAVSSIKIITLAGNTIYSKLINTPGELSLQIPVEEWANGIYFITARNGKSVCRTLKFVKN